MIDVREYLTADWRDEYAAADVDDREVMDQALEDCLRLAEAMALDAAGLTAEQFGRLLRGRQRDLEAERYSTDPAVVARALAGLSPRERRALGLPEPGRRLGVVR